MMRLPVCCSAAVGLVLCSVGLAQPRPPAGTGGGLTPLLANPPPPIDQVSRLTTRTRVLEDVIATLLTTRTATEGPTADVQDVKIGLRVICLRWYEDGENGLTSPAKAQLVLKADAIYKQLATLDGVLDGLLTPLGGPQPNQLPGQFEAEKAARERRLAALAKLAETLNRLPPDGSGDASLALANTIATLVGVLASPTGECDPARLPRVEPPRPATGPSMDEQMERLASVDPAALLAAVQGSALSVDLKRQFTELINGIILAANNPQLVPTAITYLEVLQDNLNLADAAGRSMWLPAATRQSLFSDLLKGLALFRHVPTRQNGLARLSKARDVARLVRAIETLPLPEDQKLGLGLLLDQAIKQMGDLSTAEQGRESIAVMNAFGDLALHVHSELADVPIPKSLELPYQALLKRFETERAGATKQFALLAPAAAAPALDAMRQISGDLDLLATQPAMLDRVKPYAGALYPSIESGVRDCANAIANKTPADRAAAVKRLREFADAEAVVADFAAARLGDDQLGLPLVRDLSAGNYLVVLRAAQANLADLFKAFAAGQDFAPQKRRQGELNTLLGCLKLAFIVTAQAADLQKAEGWADIEFDPAVVGMNLRFNEALRQAFSAEAQPNSPLFDRAAAVAILTGYRPLLKIQTDLIRDYAPKLPAPPTGLLALVAQLYRPVPTTNPDDPFTPALPPSRWAVVCARINEAAYCDQLGYIEHAITHLKTLMPAPQPAAPARPARPTRVRPTRPGAGGTTP